MREIKIELDEAKERVRRLKDMEIRIKVNRGRNKLTNYVGKISEIYPAVFVFVTGKEKLSFSYSDVLTKNVRFYPHV